MNNLKAKLKKQGGFTLIEMLIVVAIIAILIAIAIPMVNKALESAREATDAANERSALGIAMVEVMTESTLAGQDVSSTKQSAYYVVKSTGTGTNAGVASMGTLIAATAGGTAPDKDDGGAYGKGTALGDVESPRVGQTIKITYDPTETDEDAQYTITWE